jgi:hypothetical protein
MGTAIHNINDCQPDCAGGTYSSFPVQVALSDPATVDGRLEFGVITITPTSSHGTRESATDTCLAGAAGPCANNGPDWGYVPSGS